MQLRKSFPKIPGHMVFQSAVCKIKGHPGAEIYKSKGRWIIREAGYGKTTPPQWVQTLINAS